jgi:hypothetical protein
MGKKGIQRETVVIGYGTFYVNGRWVYLEDEGAT